MLKPRLSPSLMCANLLNLSPVLDEFRKENIDYLHIDVMDGNFVPNIMLSCEIIKQLKNECPIPLDLHLMINEPEKKIPWFYVEKNDIVTVHAESTAHLQRAIDVIKNVGAQAGVALNPSTPIEALDFLLPDIDLVCVMTVNPGFAGQKLIPQCIQKISLLRAYLDSHGYPQISIEADGNASFENIPKMRVAGADTFVCGSSSIFSKSASLHENIRQIRSFFSNE